MGPDGLIQIESTYSVMMMPRLSGWPGSSLMVTTSSYGNSIDTSRRLGIRVNSIPLISTFDFGLCLKPKLQVAAGWTSVLFPNSPRT